MPDKEANKSKLKLLLPTLPLLLVAIFFLIGWFRKVSDCTGWNAIAMMILLLLVFFLAAIILDIYWLVRYFRIHDRKWLTPLFVSIAITALVVAALFTPQDIFRSKILMQATLGTSHTKLKLRHDETYQAEVRSIDGTCFYYGQYEWEGDTLLLHDELESRTSDRFRDRYYRISADTLLPLVPDSVEYPGPMLLVIKKRKIH